MTEEIDVKKGRACGSDGGRWWVVGMPMAIVEAARRRDVRKKI
jgi:hypothetical protein